MAGEELGGTLTNSEPKKKTRKRALNPSTWKANIRKRLHQEGKEYTNASNAKVPAKKVRSKKKKSALLLIEMCTEGNPY